MTPFKKLMAQDLKKRK